MSRAKPKTFSSAREVFKTYLPKSTQEGQINSNYDKVEDTRTSKLLEDFKSSLERKVRR
ncbi:MAG: hypothetical protein GY774_36115 [Planctomycetes bacterium]|nr:hypothetical protein [Planctomycetota bacterium]